MNLKERIEQLGQAAKAGHAYRLERAILKFTEQVADRMQNNDLTPSDLAQKLNVAPSYVSKIMRGTSNFTLDSMLKLCAAVDAEFCFHVRPLEVNARWVESPKVVAKIGPAVNQVLQKREQKAPFHYGTRSLNLTSFASEEHGHADNLTELAAAA